MPLGTEYKHAIIANTYTQIHIQVVFAVQNRQALIQNHWKDELNKYITTIIQNQEHKVPTAQVSGVISMIYHWIVPTGQNKN